MKKTIWSLAALMMLIAAPIMTSCSNDLDEITPTKVEPTEETQGNVVTLTIKMSEPSESRVGIDENTLKLTGWELNDVVKVYHVERPSTSVPVQVSAAVEFTCTNPTEGTFTGTLPAGKTLADYNVAVYGPDLRDIMTAYAGFDCKNVSSNLKDAIILTGKIDNGSCTMSISNNVVKVTNYYRPIEVAWKTTYNDYTYTPRLLLDTNADFAPMGGLEVAMYFYQAKFTIPVGVSYISYPPTSQDNYEHGIFDEAGNAIIPYKRFGANGIVGKLFKFNTPLGVLPGKFSVSSTKQVYFSTGNLQATYNGSGYTWGFAANQYDCVGNAAGNTTIDNQQSGNVVDLFGWSTSATNYGINASTDNNTYRGDFRDWGSNIGDGSTWRTLSRDEWLHLFNYRTVNGGTGAGKSYSVNITYGGKMGVVLYPDNYTGSVLSGTVTTLPDGVVFLPAGGVRYDATGVSYAGERGDYWASTADIITNPSLAAVMASCILFNSTAVTPLTNAYRSHGNSVRLVADVK